jgi:hypothetical protein
MSHTREHQGETPGHTRDEHQGTPGVFGSAVYLFHGTDKIRHSFSIANNSQTNHEGLSDSSIKENVVKRAFKRYIDVHMSDNGYFRPFLDTFRIPLGKMVLLLFLAVLYGGKNSGYL